MSKKSTCICLILILLVALLLTNIPRIYVWGYQTISGDQIGSFVRAEALYTGETDIYHYPDCNAVDLYPPGGRIFMAASIVCTDIYDPFTAKLILDSFAIISVILLYFLIGNKISPEFGLLAAFIRSTYFGFVSHPGFNYTYVLPPVNQMATGMITEIMFLTTLLAIIMIFKDSSKFIHFSIIIVISSLISGLSHITPYFGVVFQLTILMSFFILFSYFTKQKEKSLFLFLRKFSVIICLLLSMVFVYLLYYSVIDLKNIDKIYNIGSLPSWLPYDLLSAVKPVSIISLIVLFFLLVYISISCSTNKKRITEKNFGLPFSKKLPLILSSLFVAYYLLVTFLVTSRLIDDYYARSRIGGIFPLYFSTKLSIPKIGASQAIGVFLFILAVIGIIYLLKSHNPLKRFLSTVFLVFYFTHLFLLFPLGNSLYYDAPADSYVISFVFAGAILGLCSPLKKLKVDNKKNLKLFTIILILVLMASLTMLNRANHDYEVREFIQPKSPLFLKGNIHPPAVTLDIINAVRFFTDDGEYILADFRSNNVLYITTDVKISAYGYHSEAKNHSKANELLGALRNDELLGKYVKKYNVRYLVVTLGDYRMPVREYENRPNLVKVYENQFGERIYHYVDVNRDSNLEHLIGE